MEFHWLVSKPFNMRVLSNLKQGPYSTAIELKNSRQTSNRIKISKLLLSYYKYWKDRAFFYVTSLCVDTH
jgi:hypothetical protein